MVVRALRARGTFLQDCSSRWVGEGNLLQIESPSEIFRIKEVCETSGPVDNEVSRVHEADVHVFSDSIVCVGGPAMNMSEIKFTERWTEHLGYYKNSARRVDGKQIHFINC